MNPIADPAGFYNAQGVRCFQEGRLADAVAAFQQALRAQPTFADAHGNLGNIYFYQGRYDEAVACYRRAVDLDPTSGIFHSNLGNVLSQQARFAEAEASCRKAVWLEPAAPASHNNLANALMGQGKLEDAAASYREAIRLKPDYADAYASLARALVDQEKIDEGMAAAQQALRLQPGCVVAYWALGVTHLARERASDAIRCFEEASRLKADYADPHWARGVALMTQNRVREALAAFDQALRIKPDHPNAHFRRGFANLLLGDLGSGFQEYEWRRRCKEFEPRQVTGPVWDGSALDGRTILLYAEQGLGDTLQFVRYAALVKQMGATVVVECQTALLHLLKRTGGIDRLIGQGSPLPPYDVQASLLSLPAILRTTSATVPVGVPYVMPDEALVEQWRQELNSMSGFRVGIAWQGNTAHKNDPFRSIPLRQFEPLARLEGVRLISLQKGEGSEQLKEVAGRFPVVDWSDRLDEASGPFMDTAALMKNLDLVVTSDTSTAHLGGALGVLVWVILPFAPDWRWQLDREDSPWYPTMRLFRPRGPKQWGEVFQRVANELQQLVEGRR
jgi:tetratricopeptide (TPR) repeat protein